MVALSWTPLWTDRRGCLEWHDASTRDKSNKQTEANIRVFFKLSTRLAQSKQFIQENMKDTVTFDQARVHVDCWQEKLTSTSNSGSGTSGQRKLLYEKGKSIRMDRRLQNTNHKS
jgi:hypothetical protein